MIYRKFALAAPSDAPLGLVLAYHVTRDQLPNPFMRAAYLYSKTRRAVNRKLVPVTSAIQWLNENTILGSHQVSLDTVDQNSAWFDLTEFNDFCFCQNFAAKKNPNVHRPLAVPRNHVYYARRTACLVYIVYRAVIWIVIWCKWSHMHTYLHTYLHLILRSLMNAALYWRPTCLRISRRRAKVRRAGTDKSFETISTLTS